MPRKVAAAFSSPKHKQGIVVRRELSMHSTTSHDGASFVHLANHSEVGWWNSFDVGVGGTVDNRLSVLQLTLLHPLRQVLRRQIDTCRLDGNMLQQYCKVLLALHSLRHFLLRRGEEVDVLADATAVPTAVAAAFPLDLSFVYMSATVALLRLLLESRAGECELDSCNINAVTCSLVLPRRQLVKVRVTVASNVV
jgi:hypothetical protein